MATRRRFHPAVQTLLFSGGENQLGSGWRPEPQARAEKLLCRRNYLRKEFEGFRGDFRKQYVRFDSGSRVC